MSGAMTRADRPIGLIAGQGQFPLLFARSASVAGRRVVAVAHEGETLRELDSVVDDVCWIRLGQLGRLLRHFKDNGVTEAVMAGGIAKTRIFSKIRLDLKAVRLAARLKSLHDDGVLRTFAGLLEDEGVRIVAAHDFVPDLLASEGVLTRKQPTRHQQKDIDFGWRMCGLLGGADVGQCVVVRHRTLTAIEAVEGTDEAIRRGGRLARRRAVVVKRPKPDQDLRFDLPAVGVETIRTMAEVKASALAIEKDKTLIFDRGEMVKLADKNGIVIVVK